MELGGGDLPVLKHLKKARALFDLAHKVLCLGVSCAVDGGYKLVHIVFVRAYEVAFLIVMRSRLTFTC